MNTYTERLELPDGQWAVLLTRLPAARYQMVRVAAAREQDMRKRALKTADPVFIAAVRDAFLWECQVKNYLTGEWTDAITAADPKVSDAVEMKALELWIAWRTDAEPGPKGSSPTDASTPSGEKAADQPETGEPTS